MYLPTTQAYFRCSKCHKQTSLRVSLKMYDPAEYACEHCGEAVWVGLDDLRDARGQRLISHRPFESEAGDEDED